MKRSLLTAAAFALCALSIVPAQAGRRDDVMSAAARCFALPDDRAWLDCYLRAAQPMQQALSVPQTPGMAVPPAYAPAVIPQLAARTPPPRKGSSFFGLSRVFGTDKPRTPQEFGSRDLPHPPQTETLNYIQARLSQYSFSQRGYFTITLDNGQVWQQIDGDSIMPLKRFQIGSLATIKSGFFGSYDLSFKGFAGLYRVRRVS